MKYDASHLRNPGASAAGQLCNYVSQNGGAAMYDRRGMPIGDEELNGFFGVVVGSESSAMHTFSFTEDIPREKLVAAVREPVRDHLDGHCVIGIHEDTDHNHIHIGEAGSMDQLYMSAGDVQQFGNAVASSVGVSYG